MSAVVMNWIAGWIPLLVLLFSFFLYYFSTNLPLATLCATVVSFGGPFMSMLWLFGLKQFWPWLLLYVFLAWIACWAAHFYSKWRLERRMTERVTTE